MRNGNRLGATALVIGLVAGCGAVAPPAATPLVIYVTPAPTASPSLAPTPSASPDPAAVRKAAAASYLTAATAATSSIRALEKKYPRLNTLGQVHAYFAASAKLEGTFLRAIRDITVPQDTASDMHALVVRETALQALYLEMAKVRTWSELTRADGDISRHVRAATAAANLIRSDLGLPPVKF